MTTNRTANVNPTEKEAAAYRPQAERCHNCGSLTICRVFARTDGQGVVSICELCEGGASFGCYLCGDDESVSRQHGRPICGPCAVERFERNEAERES